MFTALSSFGLALPSVNREIYFEGFGVVVIVVVLVAVVVGENNGIDIRVELN